MKTFGLAYDLLALFLLFVVWLGFGVVYLSTKLEVALCLSNLTAVAFGIIVWSLVKDLRAR